MKVVDSETNIKKHLYTGKGTGYNVLFYFEIILPITAKHFQGWHFFTHVILIVLVYVSIEACRFIVYKCVFSW